VNSALSEAVRRVMGRHTVPLPQCHARLPQSVQDAATHYERGELAQAEAICREILSKHPRDLEALNLLGMVKVRSGQTDEEIELFEKAVAAQPRDARSIHNLGNALAQLNRLEEALECYDRALKIAPDFTGAQRFRSKVLYDLGRVDEAEGSCRATLRLKPDCIETLTMLGRLLYGRRQPDEAVGFLNRAVVLRADDADAHLLRSLALLMKGDFERGLPGFEARHAIQAGFPQALDNQSRFTKQRWLGKQPINGKTILLHAEQGLGDTLQFCRYAKRVAALGARVLVEVQRPLATLLKSLEGPEEILIRGDPLPPHDYQTPLMSLPYAFRTSLATIPADIPYLKADPTKVEYWRERLGPHRKLRVGLVWSGEIRPWCPNSPGNTWRNIPLAMLAPLRNPGVEFYTLQKGERPEAELAALLARGWDGPELIDHTGECNRDFSDTAAFIEALDLVITVDTSVAHCAGALGKPVWIINRFNTDWRWFLDRTDTPWYPSATLYRQERMGTWEGVVQRVTRDLCRAATTA
jgi:tetratricopeptide (TPR) repeat protein